MQLRPLVWSMTLSLLFAVLAPPGALAKDKDQAPAKEEGKGPAKEEPHPGQDDELKLPPFPQDKTVRQSMELGGRTLNYNATVGSLPVLDEKGKTVADVMFIAYTVPHVRTEWRPRCFIRVSQSRRDWPEAGAIRCRRR
jgi:carboxypeptidase C (cathepsin A)